MELLHPVQFGREHDWRRSQRIRTEGEVSFEVALLETEERPAYQRIAYEADQGVRVVPSARAILKPTGPKTPRVTELLRKAIERQRQLDAGEVPNKTEIARREGITRARVTQVMSPLRLAPELRKQILTMSDTIQKSAVTERRLRPIVSGTEGARQEEPITSLMP
jgi:hypothetical protein